MYKTSTCYSFLSLLFSALTGSTDATCSRFSQNWSVSQDTQWDPHWSMHTCPILPSLALIFIRLSLCTRYKWHSFHSPVLTVSVRTGHSCGHTCTIDLATCTTGCPTCPVLPMGQMGQFRGHTHMYHCTWLSCLSCPSHNIWLDNPIDTARTCIFMIRPFLFSHVGLGMGQLYGITHVLS